MRPGNIKERRKKQVAIIGGQNHWQTSHKNLPGRFCCFRQRFVMSCVGGQISRFLATEKRSFRIAQCLHRSAKKNLRDFLRSKKFLVFALQQWQIGVAKSECLESWVNERRLQKTTVSKCVPVMSFHMQQKRTM